MNQFSLADILNAPITNVTTVTSIVAAPGAGYRIIMVGFHLTLDTAGEYVWSSAANALTGSIELVADTPDDSWSSDGILSCNENEALRLTSTTAANGWIRYVVVRT